MTIWHVDDDTLQLELAAAILQKAAPGDAIVSFEDATEAAARLRHESPDLILLDLNMPRMSGWDFIEAVAAQPGLPPIVIVTSSIDPRDKARSAQYACVRSFLIKPLRLSDVRGLLHQS